MSIEEQLAAGNCVRHLPRRERLRINEIFHSLQGEADAVGFRTVFVRLTGCPLRCQYCDTEYAFHAGEWRDIEAILARVPASIRLTSA
jgi:7-carboxy-7-deazaguanine synthase